MMYREIVTPTDQNNIIHIPQEYWNKQVEVLVLPLNEVVERETNRKKNLQELLSIGTIDIEEIRISDWNIETF